MEKRTPPTPRADATMKAAKLARNSGECLWADAPGRIVAVLIGLARFY
jgi:hypothetical protein